MSSFALFATLLAAIVSTAIGLAVVLMIGIPFSHRAARESPVSSDVGEGRDIGHETRKQIRFNHR